MLLATWEAWPIRIRLGVKLLIWIESIEIGYKVDFDQIECNL